MVNAFQSSRSVAGPRGFIRSNKWVWSRSGLSQSYKKWWQTYELKRSCSKRPMRGSPKGRKIGTNSVYYCRNYLYTIHILHVLLCRYYLYTVHILPVYYPYIDCVLYILPVYCSYTTCILSLHCLRTIPSLLAYYTHAYSALEVDQERRQDHLSQQKVLQDRVRQLEAETRASLSEKTRLVDKLSSERGEWQDTMHLYAICSESFQAFGPELGTHSLIPRPLLSSKNGTIRDSSGHSHMTGCYMYLIRTQRLLLHSL